MLKMAVFEAFQKITPQTYHKDNELNNKHMQSALSKIITNHQEVTKSYLQALMSRRFDI